MKKKIVKKMAMKKIAKGDKGGSGDILDKDARAKRFAKIQKKMGKKNA